MKLIMKDDIVFEGTPEKVAIFIRLMMPTEMFIQNFMSAREWEEEREEDDE